MNVFDLDLTESQRMMREACRKFVDDTITPFVLKNWKNEWNKRSEINNSTKEKQIKLMKKNNPTVIPRNHKVEEALAEADKGSLDKMKKLLAILKNPYDNQNNIEEYQTPAPSNNEKYQTFCGT